MTDVRPPELTIHADHDRLAQILINLVDNAVKYTPENGWVTVRARALDDGRVELMIRDTGVGIPRADLPRITERFYRVDKARSRELGGTGLGLAIVKHLVLAHGGELHDRERARGRHDGARRPAGRRPRSRRADAAAHPGSVSVKPAVVVISIDGFSAALFHDASVKVPTLRALAARGVAAAGLRPAFPSVTWPCHTTLVTGVPPARHGILGNEVLDRATGRVVRHEGDPTEAPIRAETLWDAAAAAGLATATLCWPKTRGVRSIRDNVPEFLDQPLFEEWTSRPLWDEARALGLPIERYADWSVSRPLTPMQDWLTLELTRHVVRRRPPDLLLTHFLMVDAFQHEFGPQSPEARWALEHVDGLVATLLAELATAGRLETTDVIVLGDHGFVPVEHRALPNGDLHAAGLLELDSRGRSYPVGRG